MTLSTLHAAKGLEFPVVFIAGLEEGLVPFAPREALPAEAAAEQLAEERRLFYVGMTRAMATLCLTWCAQRVLPGQPAGAREPSRFLADIPAELLVNLATAGYGRRRPAQRQLSLFPSHER